MQQKKIILLFDLIKNLFTKQNRRGLVEWFRIIKICANKWIYLVKYLEYYDKKIQVDGFAVRY